MLSLGWSTTQGHQMIVSLADSYRGPDPAGDQRAVGSGLAPARYVPLSWAIEVTVPDGIPVVAAWGDERCLSSNPVQALADSALNRTARAAGALPVNVVFPGTGLALWSDYLRQWDHFVLDSPAAEVFHVMGARDAAAGATLSRLQDLFTSTLPRLAKRFGPHISAVLMDIAPDASEEPAAVVSAYNEWLVRTFPGPSIGWKTGPSP